MDFPRPRIPTPWEINSAKVLPYSSKGSLKKSQVISGSNVLYYGTSEEDSENWLAFQKRVEELWNLFLLHNPQV